MLDSINFEGILAESGISLASLGIRGSAFRKLDAFRALKALNSDARAVLGGDVFLLQGSRLKPGLANWYASRMALESHEDFRRRSLTIAQDYISRMASPDDAEALFSIVLEDA